MARMITDVGEPLVMVNTETGEEVNVGRYGVWDDQVGHKPEVIATGDDLEALQDEYGPDLPVKLLRRREGVELG